MKKLIITTFVFIAAIWGCKPAEKESAESENQIEICQTAYDDIISFLVEGYQDRWQTSSPEEMGLSSVYRYCSSLSGFAKIDINGDGLDELLIGEGDGQYSIYDIYTMNPEDGTAKHLWSGGERDRCVINGGGCIIEEGSNSAFDSFVRCHKIQDLELTECPETAYEETLMIVQFETFASLSGSEQPTENPSESGI